MIIFTALCLWSVIFYFCVRRLYNKPVFVSNKLPKCKVNKITKKIVISIPEQTELKCPVTGDKLTKDNTHTCSCGTSYSKDVVYSKYITKCEYCSKKFEFNKPLRIYVTNENNDERLLNRALRYKIIEREGYLTFHHRDNKHIGLGRVGALKYISYNRRQIENEIELEENGVQFEVPDKPITLK